MDLKVFHDLFRFILKREQGGWFSPGEIDVLTDRGQISYFKELVADYARTQQLSDALSPFVVPPTAINTDIKGDLQLPGDYETLLMMGFDRNVPGQGLKTHPVEIKKIDELAAALSSHIEGPGPDSPAAVSTGVGVWRFYPAGMYRAVVSYLRRPKVPKYDFTMGGTDNRQVIYNQGGSGQLEWKETEINMVLMKSLQAAGVNIGLADVVQYAAVKDKENI